MPNGDLARVDGQRPRGPGRGTQANSEKARGGRSAARSYFHKSASALGPAESALLAGAIINPRMLNPAHPTARLNRRQAIILKRMGEFSPAVLRAADSSGK